MVNDQFNGLDINLNAQHVNGMTHSATWKHECKDLCLYSEII